LSHENSDTFRELLLLQTSLLEAGDSHTLDVTPWAQSPYPPDKKQNQAPNTNLDTAVAKRNIPLLLLTQYGFSKPVILLAQLPRVLAFLFYLT
jgi:hypothetical protein